MRSRNFETYLGILMLTGLLLLSTKGVEQAAMEEAVWNTAAVDNARQEKRVVVIDPGHGGSDPGKIGVNGAKEKDVNLAVARKLEKLLEKKGISAVMTRETDEGLYQEGDSGRKQADMRKRCEIIDGAGGLLAVSIHQNSYTEGSVRGPQVFYHEQSKEGEAAAKLLQEALNTGLSIERPRSVKGNNTYYLLKNTRTPIVIAECSFLSNPEEAALIVTEEYQEKVAEALLEGILSYISGK